MTGPASTDAHAPGTARAVSAVRDVLAATDAVAFVHAGHAADPDLRYLLGGRPPDRPCAVVVDDDPVVLATPPDAAALAFGDAVRRVEGDVGAAAAERLAARADGGRVLSPRHLPHDVALRVERAGFDLESTAALRDARARKGAGERDRLSSVGTAAGVGVERARARLAAATAADGALRVDGDPLDADRLWRAVAAALGGAGVAPGGTAVAAPDGPLRPGTPVVVTAAPRGPVGYRAVLARTAVVDGEGGWERRAHVGVESARRAALDAVEPGTTVDRVREEVAGELGAFGLSPPADARLVHGVGLARHEAPWPGDGTVLEPGHALVVAPGATDGNGRRVALADTLSVTADGAAILTDAPTRLSP